MLPPPITSAVDTPIDMLIEQQVVDVQIVGNKNISREKVIGLL